MRKPKIKLLLKESYLAMIKNSVGSKMFRNFYGRINGKKKDLLKNGELSCAVFISSILFFNHLIKDNHATVKSTLKDMKKSGWFRIKKLKIGSVLFWEKFDFGDGDPHEHIGFYIGNNKTVSNDYKTGRPYIHHYKFGKHNRKIESIWWHKKLDL